MPSSQASWSRNWQSAFGSAATVGAIESLRADYGRAEAVLPQDYAWVHSPQSGVDRMMLDREGGESGRATSIVRYAPGSHFPPHAHPLGEEILVLHGTFSEPEAHFPAGCYLRNPPGSSHRPSSEEGATIFVKLRQMRPEERTRVCLDTGDAARWVRRPGRQVCALFSGFGEEVRLESLDAGAPVASQAPAGGAELLVLSGALVEGGRRYPCGSWIRRPAGEAIRLVADATGATLYLKTGHLAGMGARA